MRTGIGLPLLYCLFKHCKRELRGQEAEGVGGWVGELLADIDIEL